MKKFNIYSNGQNLIAIKEGFSYPGFFFSWIWALTKKLWLYVIIGVAISAIVGSNDKAQGLMVIMSIVFGIYGNRWWAKKILASGYSLTSSVQAPNPNSAIMLAQQTR
jgi:hypothetical protein